METIAVYKMRFYRGMILTEILIVINRISGELISQVDQVQLLFPELEKDIAGFLKSEMAI